MQILLGVIPKKSGEQLFILDEGKVFLVASHDQHTAHFANYALLKERSLLIHQEPVTGSGVFRFRYGPVTSGIREAGCFYLYTFGEKILRAGVDLNWKHRGMEAAMIGKTLSDALTLSENVCSNFAVAHSIAYCRAVEAALNISVSRETMNWRIMLLEAERVYNHLHVIYKLASSAAQKVLASHLGALFEQALRLNAQLTGSRFLMGVNEVGGIKKQNLADEPAFAGQEYEKLAGRFTELYTHSLSNSNYLDRLHEAGMLTADQATSLGLTGPSLRACGVADHLNGSGIKHLTDLPVLTQNEGDALARMEIRSEELVNSCKFLSVHLQECDMWPEEKSKHAAHKEDSGEGCGVANSASGAVGYYVEIEKNKVLSAQAFTPSYVGIHAISAALENLVFTDFPFVFDSFGVHFTDASR